MKFLKIFAKIYFTLVNFTRIFIKIAIFHPTTTFLIKKYEIDSNKMFISIIGYIVNIFILKIKQLIFSKNDMHLHGAIKMFFFGTYADKIEFWKIS